MKPQTLSELTRKTANCLALLMLLLLSGCMTANTIAFATQKHTRYFHEEAEHVEKAAVTPDSRLVLWVDGKMAGADHPAKYTVSASLPASTSFIRRNAIVEGWDSNLMQAPDLIPVAVAPLVVLPDHQVSYDHRAQFNGIEGADRSVYVVHNSAHDINLEIVYVDHARVPRQTFLNLESKHVDVPHRYYLLFWLPLTIPADVATLPLQLLMWPLMAGIKC